MHYWRRSEDHSKDLTTYIDRGDPRGWRVVLRGTPQPPVRVREAARQCIRRIKRPWTPAGSRLLKVLCLLMLVLGCAVERQEPTGAGATRPATPTLKVSTELSPALQAAVATAAADWQAAGFELAFGPAEGLEANLRAGSCAELAPEGQVAPACAWAKSHILLDLEALEACRWVKRDGLTRCLRLEPADVIRHELGHWLGLGYHLPDGNVMQARYDAAGGYPKVLTELDVEAVGAAHGP
jgi:hypothetical protein